jgi:hypothetical protein
MLEARQGVINMNGKPLIQGFRIAPLGDRVFRTFRTEIRTLDFGDKVRGIGKHLFSDTPSQKNTSSRANQTGSFFPNGG